MARYDIILFYGMFEENQGFDWIPYGPLTLYSLLKAAGFKVLLVHQFQHGLEYKIIETAASDSLCLGVSAMTGYQIHAGIEAVKAFKKNASPGAPVIWGGAHPTAVPDNVLQSPYADFVCIGPAHNNIISFLKDVQAGKPQEKPFILGKESRVEIPTGKSVVHNYDLSGFSRYAFSDFDFTHLVSDNRVLNYTSSVGCPGTCTFCSWGTSLHPWNHLPVDMALDDMEYLCNRYKLKSLWFADPTLTTKRDYLLQLADGKIRRDINCYWRGNARVRELSKFEPEDYKLLADSGFDRFFLGVENCNRQVQKSFNKVFDPELVTKIVSDARGADIQLMMSFIFGTPGGPGNDLEENRAYLNSWKKINPNVRFQVGFYTPYPGTALTEAAIKKGYVPPSTLSEYGEDTFFLNVHRHHEEAFKTLPWYSQEESIDYFYRYTKLFPNTECAADWNWRDNR